MKKQTKNKFLILLICLLTQACSASNEQKGVVSSEDLTIQTTITTVTTVQDSPEIEDLTEEEAQLILAGCLREKGYDVVLGQREASDERFFKDWFKRLYYKFIKMISGDNLLLNTTGTGIFDKKIINSLKKIDDSYPYFRGLLTEITDNIKLIQFHQPVRKFGQTKNNLYTAYDLAILGIIKHSKVPLRFMTFVGFITSLFSIIIAFIFFIYKLLFWNSFDLGIAPLVIGLFGLASIQIFLLGFIGEYVMNILIQTRKVPLVIEKERINF